MREASAEVLSDVVGRFPCKMTSVPLSMNEAIGDKMCEITGTAKALPVDSSGSQLKTSDGSDGRADAPAGKPRQRSDPVLAPREDGENDLPLSGG